MMRIKIKLNEGIKEEELSDVQDYILDIDDLNSIIEKNKNNIEKCTMRAGQNARFGPQVSISSTFYVQLLRQFPCAKKVQT